MKKKFIAVLAVAILAVGAVFVMAQKASHRGDGGGRGFHGRGMGMALRGLNLTDDQKAKVKEIIEANKANSRPLMSALRENHKKMAELTANGAFDEAQVQALATEQGDLTAKMIVEKERVKSQIFAILTDEQKAQAAKMREEFKTKREQRFKGHKGDSDAPKPAEF